MTEIYNTQRNDDKIANDSRIGRRAAENNDAYKKIFDKVQADDQKSIDSYSEGFCYGCNTRDLVIQTLFYICTSCYNNRGTEGLFTNVHKKEAEELCDICGWWKFGVWQRNVAFCHRCMDRTSAIHRKYSRNKDNPFTKHLKKKYGKEYKQMQD